MFHVCFQDRFWKIHGNLRPFCQYAFRMKWFNRTGNQCLRSGTSEVSRSLECSSPPKGSVKCQTWPDDFFLGGEWSRTCGPQTGTHAPKCLQENKGVNIHPGLAVSPEIHGIMYDSGASGVDVLQRCLGCGFSTSWNPRVPNTYQMVFEIYLELQTTSLKWMELVKQWIFHVKTF